MTRGCRCRSSARRRSVHATHDTTISRLVRPGDTLTTTYEVVGVEQRKPGTFSTTRMVTTDAEGNVVVSTEQGGMYLNVATDGENRPAPGGQPLDLPPIDESKWVERRRERHEADEKNEHAHTFVVLDRA